MPLQERQDPAERSLLTALLRRLEDVSGVGPRVWHVLVPPAIDWRTSWRILARAARLRGMVPIAAPLLREHARYGGEPPQPWLGVLADRTLLVGRVTEAWSPESREELSQLLLLMGANSAHPSIILNVRRNGGAFGCECLDRPSARQGARGEPPRITERRPPSVHERPEPGWSDDGLSVASVEALLAHTGAIEGRGRAAAARRVLRREGSRLRRRGAAAGLSVWAALACACVRGGRLEEAGRVWADAWAEACRRSTIDSVLPAAPVLAQAWIEDALLARAEGLLVATLAAAESAGVDPPPLARALLAECGYWQGRFAEARARADGTGCVRGLSIASRAALALADDAGALHRAARAEAAGRSAGAEALATALCARLRVDAALGDHRHAEATEEELGRLALPPGTPALREIVLTIGESRVVRGTALTPAQRCGLQALAHPRQPRLVRARARLALALAIGGQTESLVMEVRRVVARTGARALLPGGAPGAWPLRPPAGETPMVHDVVAILETCRESAEPEAALTRVSAVLAESARRGGCGGARR